METTVGRVILNDILPEEMPFINGLLKKKGLDATGAVLLPEVRPADHGADAGRGQGPRLPLRDPRRHLDRHRRHGGARRARPRWCATPRRQVVEVQNAVPGRRHHPRRALQQDHRNLVEGHRARLREMFKADGRGRPHRPLPQPDLHHGRLRRARIEAADPPALRYARPDGQALGRDHRDPHHGQLPRRPERAAVLHLDARRPQGSGRHRAEDGRFRLPDAPPGATWRRT